MPENVFVVFERGWFECGNGPPVVVPNIVAVCGTQEELDRALAEIEGDLEVEVHPVRGSEWTG